MGEEPPQTGSGHAYGPQTVREFARGALERLPKLCGQDDSDLALIGTVREALVEEIANKLAKTSVRHLKDDRTPPALDDILDPVIYDRLRDAVSDANQVAREVVGQARRPAMEEAARRTLRREDGLSPEEAAAAVMAIPRSRRRSIPESSERTFEECLDEFLAQCRAHLSRARGEQAPWHASIPENEAPIRGQHMHRDFTRAVDPVVGDAEISEVVGRALAGLPALERRIKTAKALESQLASRTLLHGGQSDQLEAEAKLRAHFPFGLVSGRSHVALVVALYLLQSQANDTLISAVVPPPRPPVNRLQSWCVQVRNAINGALISKRESDEERGWRDQYPATAGALDCLRVVAPALEQPHVPLFLGVPGGDDAGPDHIHQIISAALPLNERTYGDDTVPWTQAHWNPLGTRLIKRANKQHYSLRNERYFNQALFEDVITEVVEYTLEDLVKRLQRAEGLRAGLPNRKRSYTHRSLLSLNKLLTDIWDHESWKRFKAFKDKVMEDSLPEEQPGNPESSQTPRIDVPGGVDFLTVGSVRAKLQELLKTTRPYAWAGNHLAERSNITDWEARFAASDAIQMIDWAHRMAPDLRTKGLDEVLKAFHTDSAELGNEPIPPHRAALMHELVIDILLTDETTAPILNDLARSVDRTATTAMTSEDPIR